MVLGCSVKKLQTTFQYKPINMDFHVDTPIRFCASPIVMLVQANQRLRIIFMDRRPAHQAHADNRSTRRSTQWLRWGAWSFLIAMGLWLALAFGAWLFLKYRRDYAEVCYTDLLWPARWPQHRVRMGNAYIAQGDALLRQGEYALAVHKLRAGVSRAPANASGRTLLARVYLAYRRPDLAKELLLGGLPHLSADPAYLQTTLAYLLEFNEDAQLQEIATRMLAAPAPPKTQPLLATFAATAAFHRGNYDQAEKLLKSHRLQDSTDGVSLLARIAWERGWPELAILQLKEHLALHPQADAPRTLLAGYYRSLGRLSEWESTLVERVAADPVAPAPRIAYLQVLQLRDDRSRLDRETTAILHQFGRDPAALVLLADFAANTGRPALARQVQQALTAHPEFAGTAALMVAEAHLVAGEYQPTLDLIARYTSDYPEWTSQFAPVLAGLQSVALSGLGRADEARLSLDHLLIQKNLRAENLVAVAHRLTALGARAPAQAVLARAVETDPLNQTALASLIRLELESGELGSLPAHLERYLRTRQPSRELLTQASAVLGSDRHLLLPAQKPLLAALQAALDPRRP